MVAATPSWCPSPKFWVAINVKRTSSTTPFTFLTPAKILQGDPSRTVRLLRYNAMLYVRMYIQKKKIEVVESASFVSQNWMAMQHYNIVIVMSLFSRVHGLMLVSWVFGFRWVSHAESVPRVKCAQSVVCKNGTTLTGTSRTRLRTWRQTHLVELRTLRALLSRNCECD